MNEEIEPSEWAGKMWNLLFFPKKEALPDMERSPATTRELRLAITDMTYDAHSLQYLYYPSALISFRPRSSHLLL